MPRAIPIITTSAVYPHASLSPTSPEVVTFALTLEQHERLSGLNDFCRRDELGRMICAHIHRATMRRMRVTTMHHYAEMALKDAWQAARDELISAVDAEFFGFAAELGRAA